VEAESSGIVVNEDGQFKLGITMVKLGKRFSHERTESRKRIV